MIRITGKIVRLEVYRVEAPPPPPPPPPRTDVSAQRCSGPVCTTCEELES